MNLSRRLRILSVLVASVMIQMCLGATYSWPVFVAPLRAATGLGQGTVQTPVSLFYFIFPCTALASGYLMRRFSPRICALAAGIIFSAGWILAGLGGANMTLTTVGIGVLGGMGVGLGYLVPISTCVQWLPRHKGLVTGIAVAGFGGGAALISHSAGWMMESADLSPYTSFIILGSVFFVLICSSAFFLLLPPEETIRHSTRFFPGDALKTSTFWILYLAMGAGLAAGFSVNTNLRELYTGGHAASGVKAVAFFALANAAGRIVWGLFFDRFKSAHVLLCNLGLQAAILFFNPVLLQHINGLYLFSILTGFNYGGVLVLFASTTARRWGHHRMSEVYAWIFSSNIPAALSPLIVGYTYDQTGTFHLPLRAIALIVLLSAVAILLRRNDISSLHIEDESRM